MTAPTNLPELPDYLKGAGLAIFPECLKSEYHGVRASLEAYSRGKDLPDEPTPACGAVLRDGQTAPITVRVTNAAGQTSDYKLDRLD